MERPIADALASAMGLCVLFLYSRRVCPLFIQKNPYLHSGAGYDLQSAYYPAATNTPIFKENALR